uniref:DNA-directed DNA polymerase n=1 Tax=Angiostrongylus cantonensis TaxID=6313 RepID=A0A158PCL6_ANGCA
MPGFIAKKLCPQLEVVPGNFGKYRRESMKFEAIFSDYDEELSMGSLDEAYLDITAYVAAKSKPSTLIRRRFGGECICKLPLIADNSVSPSSTETCSKCGKERKVFEDSVEFGVGRSEIVREIRFRVEQASGLTCSAGIAPNFMLAKICSDINKPNGQFELANRYEDVMKFLSDLPIRKSFRKNTKLRSMDCCIRRRIYSLNPIQESFLRIALGLPGRPSTSDTRRKSISVERTFTPTSDRSVLNEIMEEVGSMLVKDMADAGVVGGRCVTLKLRLSSFDVLTRSVTPKRLLSSRDDILVVMRDVLEREMPREIRLLGIRLSNLQLVNDRLTDTPVSVNFSRIGHLVD